MNRSVVSRFPKLLRRFRPSLAEVDFYARMILKHERRPLSSLALCQHEAEMQLWAMRSLGVSPDEGAMRFAGA